MKMNTKQFFDTWFVEVLSVAENQVCVVCGEKKYQPLRECFEDILGIPMKDAWVTENNIFCQCKNSTLTSLDIKNISEISPNFEVMSTQFDEGPELVIKFLGLAGEEDVLTSLNEQLDEALGI